MLGNTSRLCKDTITLQIVVSLRALSLVPVGLRAYLVIQDMFVGV